MKAMLGRWLSGCALALAVIGSASGVANAAPCTVALDATNPDGSLSHATDCGIATPTPGHSPASTGAALTTADPGGLGLTWTFIDRDPNDGPDPTDPGETDAALVMTGVGATSGTWMIDRNAFSSAFDTFVVTMKGGNPLQSDFLWFLIDTTASATGCAAGYELCGTWNMYGKVNGAGLPTAKAISHMDLFAADNPGGTITRLPEPGSVALLAMVLGGIGIVSRRRR